MSQMSRIPSWLLVFVVTLLAAPWPIAAQPGAVPPPFAVVGACPAETVRNSALGVALPLPTGWEEATPNMAPPGEISLAVPGYAGAPRLLIDSLGVTTDPDPTHAAAVAAARLARGLSVPITRTPLIVANAPGMLLQGLPGQTATVQIVLAHAGGLYRIILFGSPTLTPAGRAVLDSISFIPRTAPFPKPSTPADPLPGPIPSILALTVGRTPGGDGVAVGITSHAYRPNQVVALHLCWQGTPLSAIRTVPSYDTLDRVVRTDSRGDLMVTLTVPIVPTRYSAYTVRLFAHDARIGNLLGAASGLVGSGRPTSGPAACPPTYRDVPNTRAEVHIAIDWISFVHTGGVDYATPVERGGRALAPADIEPRVATICFQVADHVEVPTYQVKDGDAAFLTPGTPLYAVRGYRPTFRLAAWQANQLTLFEVDRNPRARQGGDLFDIGGKVRYIGVNSEADGTTELAAIRDPRTVQALVSQLLTAPIAPQLTNAEERGPRYFLAFHLMDGTAVIRSFWTGSGALAPGVLLPPAIGTTVRVAVARAARHGA